MKGKEGGNKESEGMETERRGGNWKRKKEDWEGSWEWTRLNPDLDQKLYRPFSL
jgi:hypothetical protein